MIKGYRTSRRVLRDALGFSEPFAGDKKARQAGLGAASAATGTAAGYGGQAGSIGSTLVPELTQEAKNPTGFNPTDLNAMQVGAQQGAGGAAGSLVGEATTHAARSRNIGALPGQLDSIARSKTMADSNANLGIQGMNAQEKLKQKQQGLQGLAGVYGTDVGAQLKAQGLVPEDLNAVAKADESGWQQDMQGWMKALGGAAQGAGAMGLKFPGT
jgi:hypothetical protein